MVKWKERLNKEGICYRLESYRQQVWLYCKRFTLSDVCIGAGISGFFAFFFYRSIWGLPPMLLVGGLFVHERQLGKQKALQRLHLEQFKECVLAVLGVLKAGYAVENAFGESVADMEVMYGKGCWIAEEIKILCRGVQNNKTLEEELLELANRSGLAEIYEFVEVFGIAKRSSGNIPESIALYSKIITEKLELSAEMETLLAAKRLEQKVMNVMPFLIVLYLEYSNPGYFDMMYHNWMGVLIMTGCLFVYLVAYVLAERIFRKAYE